MESNLSPAPWTTDPECGDESVLDADGFMVADCAIFSLRRGFSERGVSNARAVALIPALLEYVGSSAANGCATAQELLARLSPPQDR